MTTGGGFITERLRALIEKFPGTTQQGTLRDKWGVYAFSIQSPKNLSYYFVAKNSMKGDIISVHKSLLTDAVRYGKPIILALKEDFYRYDPTTILENIQFENVFHGAQMVNFRVSLGKNLMKDYPKPPAPQPDLFSSEEANT